MKKTRFRTAGILLSPLLTFFVLFLPYQWLNSSILVKRLGCGCPQVDAAGNVINSFNANDFTACFWLLIALGVTGAAIPLSGKLLKDKVWLRIPYILLMAGLSLAIALHFLQRMMWK